MCMKLTAHVHMDDLTNAYVTTDPIPGGGRGIAGEMSGGFDQRFVTAVRGKYPGFALDKRVEMKR